MDKEFMTKLLVSFLATSAFWMTAQSFAGDRCSSEDERSAVGEILGLATACKEAFPDLRTQVDHTMKPLKDAFPGCFAQFEKPGPDRSTLEVAVAMGKGELSRNKQQFCVSDLQTGVKAVHAALKK